MKYNIYFIKTNSFTVIVRKEEHIMAYAITNIKDTVDGKFLVIRNISNQAESGTMVHIMGAKSNKDGSFLLDYRVTSTGQNYKIAFKKMKDFFHWARPDTFIARNYDSFTKDEIKKYVKINNRTFSSYCVPLILVLLIIVWGLSLTLIPTLTAQIITGASVSVVVAIVIFILYKKSKSNIKMKMYYKLSDKWGVKFK